MTLGQGIVEKNREMEPRSIPPRRVLLFGSTTHILSDLFFALLIPLLPTIKNDLQLSYTEIGMLRSAFSGASAVLQIPAGFLAEHVGEFWMLLGGNAWVSIGLIGMAVMPGFWSLISMTIIGGLGGGTQHPLASSMVSRAYESSGRSSAVGTVNFAGDLGKMLAPASAAGLLLFGTWRTALWVVGAIGLFFMAAGIPLKSKLDLGKPLQQVSSSITEQNGSASKLSGFIVLTVIGILDNAVRNGALILFPFILIERGMTEGQITLMLFLLFAGGAAGKYVCGWLDERVGTIPLIWLTKGMTAALIISTLIAPAISLWPLALILGVGLNGTSSVLYATVAKFIPAQRRARYYGYFYTTNEIGTVGAPLAYGLIADQMGLRTSILIMGVVTSLILPASLALSKHLKEEPKTM
jgi:MFS family permease